MIQFHNFQLGQIWEEAGKTLCEVLEKNKKEKILLLLSGGSVVGMYGKLGEFLKGFNGKIALGQVDERFLSESKLKVKSEKLKVNVDINANAIWKTGLWQVCEERKIPYFVVSQEGTFEKSANDYNETMFQCYKEYDYKMAVLGIGEDGHTAGLLPGYAKGWDKERWVVGYKNSSVYPQRITITPKAIRLLDYALVAAVGGEKKWAIEKIVKDIRDANIDRTPGLLLRGIQNVDLFTDQNIKE